MSVSEGDGRDPITGRLKPGFSLNPSGRPKGLGQRVTLAQACRAQTPAALKALVYWMNQRKFPAQAVKAAEVILDRGHGKAVQPIADGNEHPSLSLDLTDMDGHDLKRLEGTLKRLLARSVATTILADDPDPVDATPVDATPVDAT